jgi:UTP--glucose-1-phosphate uridylyltransferase
VEGASLNEWLQEAGYAPVPMLHLVRSAVRTRGGAQRMQADAGMATGWDAARWVEWLDIMGLREETVARLMKGMESARPSEQRKAMNVVAGTLSRVAEMLETPVHTAVIPAAGGHHQLIAHHVMQRLLLRAIREAVECGISEVVVVLAPGMMDSLYTPLKESLDIMLAPSVNLRYCVQAEPHGLGDAVLQAEEFVGHQPFAVLLPDDVLSMRAGQTAYARELRLMIDAHVRLRGAHLVAVAPVPRSKMTQYGIVEAEDGAVTVNAIMQLIEKPDPTHPIFKSPRALGIVGRYLLNPEIFEALRELKKEQSRPLELTAALDILRQAGREVYAFGVRGTRQDIGEVLSQASELIESSAHGGHPA